MTAAATPIAPADAAARDRVAAAARAELQPEQKPAAAPAPSAAAATPSPAPAPAPAPPRTPARAPDVAMVARALLSLVGVLLARKWPGVGLRVIAAIPDAAQKLGEFVAPKLGAPGAWSFAATVSSIVAVSDADVERAKAAIAATAPEGGAT